MCLDQKAETEASVAAAGLRRRRDLRREEEWKKGKREKEKRRNERERENQFNKKKRGVMKQISKMNRFTKHIEVV